MEKRKRILTGDTPTGKLHLGHFVGTLENRVKLQTEYDTYILLANTHAFAKDATKPEDIYKNTLEDALDNLAVGLNPEKASLVLESLIPEIFELYTYFGMLASHNRVLRNPTVKEEIVYKKLGEHVSFGFVGYPILQAADILSLKADLVPVGQDQVPHLEQTREIARRFNELYGETFPVPEALVGRVARLPGTDGKAKMSKSLGNVIYLSDPAETVKHKVMMMYTDPTRARATDPGHVEGNPVFIYHDAFNPDKNEVADLKERYLKGKVGDIEVKEKLVKALNSFLDPIRSRRLGYEKNPGKVIEIIRTGTEKASQLAVSTLAEVREKLKLRL
ncbi:MAG: tryptophan--tRNA ligase [Patescibacteria group bacterium]